MPQFTHNNRFAFGAGFGLGAVLSLLIFLLAFGYSMPGLESFHVWLINTTGFLCGMTGVGLALLGGGLGILAGLAVRYAMQWCWQSSHDASDSLSKREDYEEIHSENEEPIPPQNISNDANNALSIVPTASMSDTNEVSRSTNISSTAAQDIVELEAWGEMVTEALRAKILSEGAEIITEFLSEQLRAFKIKRDALLLKYHPDRNPDPAAKAACQTLLELCQALPKNWQSIVENNETYAASQEIWIIIERVKEQQRQIEEFQREFKEKLNQFEIGINEFKQEQASFEQEQASFEQEQASFEQEQALYKQEQASRTQNTQTRLQKMEQQIQQLSQQLSPPQPENAPTAVVGDSEPGLRL